ncbi:MAG TPA: segregation and condensation protein A [Gammaproteobacteria bacterium]|nr:segregation and condensation protein A [Gammaproteobacteria bacterium]
MDTDSLNKEQRIMIAMRKTLAKIVRDTTPSSSLHQRPLKDDTIEDIRQCFNLISARERELAEAQGKTLNERPRYADEEKTTNVLKFKGYKPAEDAKEGE